MKKIVFRACLNFKLFKINDFGENDLILIFNKPLLTFDSLSYHGFKKVKLNSKSGICSFKLNFKHALIILIVCLYFFNACDTSPKPEPPIGETPVDSTQNTQEAFLTEKIAGMPFSLFVTNEATIYEKPSATTAVIGKAAAGDSIVFTNEVSIHIATQKIQNTEYKAPWLRVITLDNKMGWLHGGYVDFHPHQNKALADKVLYPRIAQFFGGNMVEQIRIYNKEKDNIQTLPAFRLLYTRAATLKDSISIKLNKMLQLNPSAENLDFFWLNDFLEGLTLNYIEDEKQYYLFRNFKHWQQLSQATPHTADDNFVEVMLQTYQMDSIEYHLYDWQMPLDNGIICSTLGQGNYTKVLDKIALTQDDSTGYFEAEITAIKQAIINDISSANHFWLPLESIMKELDQILNESYVFLDDNDKVELKTKQQLLKKYQKNDIKVNLFEGI